jgi:hypothetical protein
MGASSDDRRVVCDAALASNDAAAIQECVAEWVTDAPDSAWTEWYAFQLALLEGDARAAHAARTRAAGKSGLPDDKYREMQLTRLPHSWIVTVSQWGLGGVVLLIIGGVVSLRVRSFSQRAQDRYQG